jgi:hypothetical protein
MSAHLTTLRARYKRYKPFLRRALGVAPDVRFHETLEQMHKHVLARPPVPLITKKAISGTLTSIVAPFVTGSMLPVKNAGRWQYHINSIERTMPEEIAHAAVCEAVLKREARASRRPNPLAHFNRYKDFHEAAAKALAVVLVEREKRPQDRQYFLQRGPIDIPERLRVMKDYDVKYGRQQVGQETLTGTILQLANHDHTKVVAMIQELIDKRLYNSRDAFDYIVKKYHTE